MHNECVFSVLLLHFYFLFESRIKKKTIQEHLLLLKKCAKLNQLSCRVTRLNLKQPTI